MMCFGSREDVEVKRSKEIDALIHRDEKVMQRQVKLLLLGKLSLSLSRPPQLRSTTTTNRGRGDIVISRRLVALTLMARCRRPEC